MITDADIDKFFQDGGLLSEAIDGYVPRPGQIEISKSVLRAMKDGKHLFAEGPCGIGKSFAYLVPAILTAVHTGGKVVVATANIALQEQLIEKDLPFLAEVLPVPFKYAIMKGKNNYYCETRMKACNEEAVPNLFSSPQEDKQREAILEWAQETQTGDVSEIEFKPMGKVWGKMCGAFEDCDSKMCEKKKCFSYQAKLKTLSADVIVTNYHILFAHLALKEKTGGNDVVLPPFDFVILDEGHEAEDIARDFFGHDIRQNGLRRMGRGCKDKAITEAVAASAKVFTGALKEVYNDPKYKLRFRDGMDDRIIAASEPVFKSIELLQGYWSKELRHSKKIGAHPDYIHRVENHRKRLLELRDRLVAVMSMEDENLVVWIEESTFKGKYTSYNLLAKPLDVSELIRHRLFIPYQSVIVTSATLTASKSFSFIRNRLGVGGDKRVRECKVESPFNFAAQAMLIIPNIGCDPRSDDFPTRVAHHLQKVIDEVGGKTLGLFTSYRVLNAAAGVIQGKGKKIYRQGEAPRTKLVQAFKEDVTSCLLGTTSFWTGVDVPGESLSCVVIDKLPFPNPSDPIVDAINESDDNSFFKYSIPRACIAFRQGFGRLIRSKDCKGIVVCFDERLMTKKYGSRFIRSLPKCKKTRNLDRLPEFLAAQRVGPSMS